jgi:hypothetical protein
MVNYDNLDDLNFILVRFIFRSTVANGPRCTGNRTTTERVLGSLPHMLPVGVEDDTKYNFRARHCPLRVTLQEYHNGLDQPPRDVVYALNTLLHSTGNHFTSHGFIANGAEAPYPFFHDAIRRPLVRPTEMDENGFITYDYKVYRAWYTRVGVV